jgi:hypothetical protein
MSLLTKEQFKEIQNFHDDIGECTEPHEECFIKKMIEWNEKQSAMLNQEVSAIGYLYKQQDCYGDIQTVFNFDKPYITWHNVTDVTPVYTAPPKREPPITSREMYQRGYAAAERDLKPEQQPLSDEAICEVLLKKEWFGFVELVRIIEKMHGIGVDDENHDA